MIRPSHTSTRVCRRLLSTQIQDLSELVIQRAKELPIDPNNPIERLSSMKLVLRESNNLNRSVKHCLKLYQSLPTTMFEDIHENPYQATELVTDLARKYTYSSAVRELIFNDLIEMYRQGKYQSLQQTLQTINSWKRRLPSRVVQDPNFQQVLTGDISQCSQQQIFNVLVVLFAYSGSPLLSTSLLLAHSNVSGLELEVQSIHLVLHTLCSDTVVGNTYGCYSVLTLLKQFPDIHIPLTLNNRMLDYFLAQYSFPSFVNKLVQLINIQERLKEPIDDEETHKEFIQLCSTVVSRNLEFGNVARALAIWEMLPLDLIPLQTTQLLIDRLGKIDIKRANEILFTLDKETYKSPELQSFLLRYFGNQTNMKSYFQAQVRNIQAPVPRHALESMLQVFLLRGDNEASERILETIVVSKGGLSANGVNYIVKKFLSEHEPKRAMDVITKLNDSQLQKYAYVSMLEYTLKENSNNITSPMINRMAETIAKTFKGISKGDDALDMLSTTVIQQVIEIQGSRAAQKVYCIGRNNFIKDGKSDRNTKKPLPILALSKIEHLLLISDKERIPRCVQILKTAVTKNERGPDVGLVEWCVEEMISGGMTLPEVMDTIRLECPEGIKVFKQEYVNRM
ncbi:hypothetical protein CAAN1_03S06392 [[Candida] anglica]|uniref:Uncharacterized protein n=1 Tax=[Candida] anglica TaxID=148631 RepID=A0ABP0EH94_9ASCO